MFDPMPNKFEESLVSIIVPAYRVAKLVDDTINSVLAQTYKNWEMLIVDDCSPDNTIEVVRRAAENDSRVRLIESVANGGPAKARNAAIQQAKGRWIAFLDSDDVWLPSKLEDSIEFAKSKGACLVFTGFRRMSFEGGAIGHYVSVPERLTYRQLLGNTAIATSTVLIDRALAGDIVMRSVFYDDFVCWLELLKKGHVAWGLNKDLMRYRVVANSVSRNKKRSAKEVWKTYRQIENLGMLLSVWYFLNYAIRGILKYRKL